MRWSRWSIALVVIALLAFVAYFFLSNQRQATKISIEQAWARPAQFQQAMSHNESGNMSMGQSDSSDHPGSMAMDQSDAINSAVYMTIHNNSEMADRLIAVESDIAKSVELHQTLQQGDIMQMQPVDALDIPAKSQVVLAPGGYHIMLVGLTRELKVGDRFSMTLVFEKNGRIPITVEVRQP